MFDTEFPISEEMGKITASSTYDDSGDLCLKNSSSTHQTRLVRTVNYAFAEIGATQDFAGVVHGLEFGMCEDSLFGCFPASISCDQLALACYHSANRQFAGLFGLTGFGNGKLHIVLISVHTPLRDFYRGSGRPSAS